MRKMKTKTKTKMKKEIPIIWASENDKLTWGSKEAEAVAKVAVEAAKFRSCQTQLANKSAAECKGKFETLVKGGQESTAPNPKTLSPSCRFNLS